MYLWLKWIHVIGMVIYVGGLLTLTRLLGHAVRFEAATSRADTYRVLKRMHKFVDWGGLFLMLAAGLWLLIADPMGKAYMKQGYFHLKLLCMVALLVCDVMLSRKLFRMEGDGPNPEAWFFKVMHGVAGLALLAALAAVFIVRG
ncbi:MAG: CopD family protein [Planctomycetota bacterium]|jgi:putative membrane protein